MNLFKTHLKRVVVNDNLLLNPKSQIQDLPKLTSLSLSAKFDGDPGSYVSTLALLGLNKPGLTRSKVHSLSLGLRKGQVVGCKLSLRKDSMYTFLERFLFEIIPSIKNLSSLSIQNDGLHWHFSDVFVLDDISTHYIFLQGIGSLDLVIKTKKANLSFYQGLRLPIIKKDFKN